MSCRPTLPFFNKQEDMVRRVIGLDIHRTFAEAVAWEDGRLSGSAVWT